MDHNDSEKDCDGRGSAPAAALTVRLRLTEDVHITPRVHRGVANYQFELLARGKFLRVGPREFALLSRLRPQITVAEAWTASNADLKDDALSEQEVVHISRWAVASGLVHVCGGDLPALPASRGERARQPLWNPFWIKVSCGSPQAVMASLSPYLGWAHSPASMSLACGLFGVAALTLAAHWHEFTHQSRHVFHSSNWLWIAAAWFVLKLLHETSHALVCRRHGGHVRDWGVAFVLFAPMPYVDVTSSWRFPHRWQRMQTAFAGIYIELIAASLCVFAWVWAENPLMRQILHTTIVTASVTTVLFNANPLMRFDGYFLLSDLLRIPNLYRLGAASVAASCRRLLFGEPRSRSATVTWEGMIVAVYGWAAFAWRILVCASLVLAASALFHGAGVVLAALGLVAWTRRPLMRAAGLLTTLLQQRPQAVVRAAAVTTWLIAAAYILLFQLPLSGFCLAPAFIRFADPHSVRAEAAGFVDEVFVKNGDAISAGDLLFRLRNEELNAQVEELRLALARAQLKASALLEEGEIGAAFQEQNEVELLNKHLRQKQQQQAALDVWAAVSGRVVARNIDQLKGRFVAEGDALVTLVDEHSMELTASVSQHQADRISSDHLQLSFFAPGVGWRDAVDLTIDPRADRTPPHEALLTLYGGSLPGELTTTQSGKTYRFLAPRLNVTGSVDASTAEHLASGQLVSSRLTVAPRPLSAVLRWYVVSWFRAHAERANH